METSSEAIVCQHCGAPLANNGMKISQCDHCNSHNELKPDIEKELMLSKLAKQAEEDVLVLLKSNPRNFTSQEIIRHVSAYILAENRSVFAGLMQKSLNQMVKGGVLKVVRGRVGGYQLA